MSPRRSLHRSLRRSLHRSLHRSLRRSLHRWNGWDIAWRLHVPGMCSEFAEFLEDSERRTDGSLWR